MTHNDIYTKFLIEYDKANVTSSYPALTEYEIATLLDRAYLLLIARKLTGNNTRRAPFEYDTKAVEDLRPLIKTQQLQFRSVGTVANELLYSLPTDMLYYLQGVAEFAKGSYGKELLTTVDHKIADNFKATNSNIPWIKKPVAYLESNEVHMLFDPYKHADRTGSLVGTWHTQEQGREQSSFIAPKLIATYIVTPAKFAIGVPPEEEENAGNNNGGNNNGGQHSGNSDVADNTAWDICENFPESMDNATNSIFFYAYAQKDTYRVSCNIEIISGSSILEIQKTTVDGYENYGYVASGNASGIAGVKISCSSDPSISITKRINITYNNIIPENNPSSDPIPDPQISSDIQYVDLGLPSGTKWGDRNIGASSVNERGTFYGWGEITGTVKSQNGRYGDRILIERNVSFPVDISTSNKDLDVAYMTLGGYWHTPTTEQMIELTTHCTWTLYENYNGVEGLFGYEVRGKNEYSNNAIFIPCNGYRNGVDAQGNPNYSTNVNEPYYWSSEISGSEGLYRFGKFVKLYRLNTKVNQVRTYLGMYIRPVYSEPVGGVDQSYNTTIEGSNVRMVDLGLSSLWADRNIGANVSYDNNNDIVTVDKGEYISWGETGAKESYHSSDYPYYEDNSITDYYYIKPQYDAAKQRWGSNFRMPNTEDIDDLLTKCEATWEEHVDSNGNRVAGMRFTSTNGNSIFLPAGGYTYHDHYDNLTYYKDNDYGYYWSNTKLQPEDKRASLCILFDQNKDHLDCSWLSRFVGILVRPVSPKQTT